MKESRNARPVNEGEDGRLQSSTGGARLGASSKRLPHVDSSARVAPASGGRPKSDDLTATEIRAISEFIAHPVKAAVAKKLGVSERTLIRMFQKPTVDAEYTRQLAALQQELWSKMVASKDELWEGLLALTRDENPSVRFRAITWVLGNVLTPPRLVAPPVRSEIDEALTARMTALADAMITDARIGERS